MSTTETSLLQQVTVSQRIAQFNLLSNPQESAARRPIAGNCDGLSLRHVTRRRAEEGNVDSGDIELEVIYFNSSGGDTQTPVHALVHTHTHIHTHTHTQNRYKHTNANILVIYSA